MTMSMSPEQRFSLALIFATNVHRDQIYHGEPYICHVIRVALRLPMDLRIVALLHDAFADTNQVRPSWLTLDEREALISLTRYHNESYFDYIDRVIRGGDIPIKVKEADILENLSCHPPEDYFRIKYEKALKMIRDSRDLHTKDGIE
jgi:hypothetical protein